MICPKCGSAEEDGSVFCGVCGGALQPPVAPPPPPVAPPPASPPPPPPPAYPGYPVQATGPVLPPPYPGGSADDRKKSGGVFSSPAGIALVVIIGIAVVAGIVFGIILLTRNGSNDGAVDAETMKAWDEYQSLLEQDGDDLAKIDIDAIALAQAQADLKKMEKRVEALEQVLAETGGTPARRSNPNVKYTNVRDTKADQLAASLAAYKAYIKKMNEFFGTLIEAMDADLLSNTTVVDALNKILEELQALAADVKKTANSFISGNNEVASGKFDPSVLDIPDILANDVEDAILISREAEAGNQTDQTQEQTQYVTCPNCYGVGTVEGGDGRYVCGFCNGAGTVTSTKAATYNPADWRDY